MQLVWPTSVRIVLLVFFQEINYLLLVVFLYHLRTSHQLTPDTEMVKLIKSDIKELNTKTLVHLENRK